MRDKSSSANETMTTKMSANTPQLGYQHYHRQIDGEEIQRNLIQNNSLLFENHNARRSFSQQDSPVRSFVPEDSIESSCSMSEHSQKEKTLRRGSTTSAYRKTTRDKNKIKLHALTTKLKWIIVLLILLNYTGCALVLWEYIRFVEDGGLQWEVGDGNPFTFIIRLAIFILSSVQAYLCYKKRKQEQNIVKLLREIHRIGLKFKNGNECVDVGLVLYHIFFLNLPFLNYTITFEEIDGIRYYSLNSVMAAGYMLRMFSFLFVFQLPASLSSPISLSIQTRYLYMYDNSLYSYKYAFKQWPCAVLLVLGILSTVVLGIQIFIFESVALGSFDDNPDNQYIHFWNGLWTAILTMTTIGYGDIFPISHFGRAVSIAACIFGSFLFSVMTLLVENMISMDEEESKIYNAIQNKNTSKERIKIDEKAVLPQIEKQIERLARISLKYPHQRGEKIRRAHKELTKEMNLFKDQIQERKRNLVLQEMEVADALTEVRESICVSVETHLIDPLYRVDQLGTNLNEALRNELRDVETHLQEFTLNCEALVDAEKSSPKEMENSMDSPSNSSSYLS